MNWEEGASGKSCLRLDIGSGSPFASSNLAGIGLHAQELEAAVGTDHGDAVCFHRGNLADFTGDAFGVLGRQRLGLENLDGLAVERCPGARRRTAATDQAIDLLPGLAPV